MPANNLSGTHAHRVQMQRGPNAHASAATSNAYKGYLSGRPRLNTTRQSTDGNRIRHHLAGAMFLPFDPSAQDSWPPASAPAYRPRLPRPSPLVSGRGIVFLFPKNLSGEGRWIMLATNTVTSVSICLTHSSRNRAVSSLAHRWDRPPPQFAE